eukprot:TRINITY_DN15358_c0_g1_i1.p1 TRINITY_DN15358_c0_g1~~TRINITY_DN15358_c0_g1_i1.p1  ORF type:complete len:618 (+),score=92.71 TRINITY_DN15358_c0_g1_i1:80-1933(+)
MSESTWDVLVGDYDWGFLCMPRVPWGSKKPPPPMFAKDEPISLLVAVAMGLQHAMAMVGGIVTVPLIIGGTFVAGFTPSEQAYIISAALICSSLSTFVQVTQIKIPGTNYAIGSGLLSVMGVSFTFLPIAESSIGVMRKSGLTGQQAYGKLLGTLLVCCFLEITLSFAPQKVLKKLFPPVVTGTTVLLVGFALSASGVQYWGGGVYCAQQVLTSKAICDTNGEVELPFGSKEYVGLGAVTFFTLIVTELFGSPFMRNVQVVMGLLVGMIVASSITKIQCETVCQDPVCTNECFNVLPLGLSYDNVTKTVVGTAGVPFINQTVCEESCQPAVCVEQCSTNRYVTGAKISEAKWITFLWVHTFPLGFYAPAVLPFCFGFLVSTMECIGDVTATTEASGLIPLGDDFEKAVRGGILADGINCFLAAWATTFPTVTYAANNGIISLTRCGSRRAGLACATFLFFLGICAKFAGVILSIPDCVFGGMQTFLFINVAVSGMKILTLGEGINRRNRFICALALSVGAGVALVPEWVNISGQAEYPHEGNLWPIKDSWSSAYRGFRDALIIVASNGFSIGGFMAVVLNLIIPHDLDDVDEEGKFEKEMEAAAHKGFDDEKMKEEP